jgi:nucleotide-binding universal stress UspA family protein
MIVAVEIPTLPVTEAAVLSAQFFEDAEKAARNRAGAIIEDALAKFRAHGDQLPPVTTAIIGDSPKEAIVEEAERWGADLVVVGSHGYRGFKRYLLGSVSQAVATRAKCSVEIVRAGHDGEGGDLLKEDTT